MGAAGLGGILLTSLVACMYNRSQRKKLKKHQERIQQQQRQRQIPVKNQIKMRPLPSNNPDFDTRSVLSSRTIDENDSVSQVGRSRPRAPRQRASEHTNKTRLGVTKYPIDTPSSVPETTESKEDLVNKLAEKLKDNPEMEQALLNLPLDPGEDEDVPREIKCVLRKFGSETLLQTLNEIDETKMSDKL